MNRWLLMCRHCAFFVIMLFLSFGVVSHTQIAPTTQAQGNVPSPTSTADQELRASANLPLNLPYRQAPSLNAQVDAGQLPVVEERIPLNPRILPVYDEIGQYGGTWHRAYTGLGDRFGPTKLIEERAIEFYMADGDTLTLELNWVDQFEPNENSSVYTIHIREGLRWSDGVLVTTEDVRFWYEDVLLNPAFFPSMPADFVIDGEPGTVEIIDDYTFEVHFAAPYPLYPTLVARATPGTIGLQGTSFVLPSHYLKQYHPSYTPQAELDKIVAEYGVDDWTELWGDGPVQAWWRNPDIPVLSAWVITQPAPAEAMIMVRNPYYHAVDPAGNQLPYIDEIVHRLATDNELISIWTAQGLIDLQARHLGVSEYDYINSNQDSGDYRVEFWRGSSTDALFINLNTPDPTLAALFDDRRFRQALSISIDREEMLTLVYNGLGEVRQASPVTGSPNFDPEFEQRWTEYDPELANSLLDEMGLAERNTDGIRLRPDGNPLQITVSTTSQSTVENSLIQQYWSALGIDVTIEILDRLEYERRTQAGDIEVGSWLFDRNVVLSADPGRYLGITTDGPWAPLYAAWYASDGVDGVEPPPDHPIRQVWQAWENAKTASTVEETEAYIREMVDIHKENIWVIGIVGEIPSMYVVSNRIRNFPPPLIHATVLRDIGIAQPAQFYFTDPAS